MPISFPVNIFTHFSDGGAGGLKVVQRQFDLTDPRNVQETFGGESVVSYFGTNLWYGNVVVVPLHNALQRQAEAKVRALMRHDARFFIGDLMDDPLVGNYGEPTLTEVLPADNYTIRIDGLTPNYALPVGTKLAFSYGGGKRALHETVVRSVANASGQVTVSVFPIVQPGWVVGNPIALAGDAMCKAFMLPKSLKTGVAGPTSTEGFSFSWRQTLEA